MNEHRTPGAGSTVGDYARRAAEPLSRARRGWSGADSRGRLRDLPAKAGSTAKRAARTVRTSASDADGYVRHTVETRPLTAVCVALGVGFLLGRMGGRR